MKTFIKKLAKRCSGVDAVCSVSNWLSAAIPRLYSKKNWR